MARYIVPLEARPQTFTITLGGVEYRLTVRWCEAAEGGWLLDIARAEGAALIAGMPLVTGTDLVGQHGHLGFGGLLWCSSPSDLPPGPDDLGAGVQLIFEVMEGASDVA